MEVGDEQSSSAVLDALGARLVRQAPCQFTIATTEAERAVAYRLRYQSVIERGWATASDHPDGMERDEFDDRAVHVVGRVGDLPVCTGRLVLPPGPLPTEMACGMPVDPAGRVVDAGRLVVAQSQGGVRHGVLIALLATLYLEARRRGFSEGCGMMAANVRSLARLIGLRLELLGPERPYWHEMRAPVRFSADTSVESLVERWSADGAAQGAARTSTALIPPKPNEFDRP